MKALAVVLLATVAALACAVRAADTLSTRPLAALAVLHCDAIAVIWIVGPTKITRYDAEHPPSDRQVVLAQMDAAMIRDAIEVRCAPHPVDTAQTTGLRK